MFKVKCCRNLYRVRLDNVNRIRGTRVICDLSNIIIIIIIIKKGRQCKAEREWYTPYQSEDPSPTIPTYRQNEAKWKKSRRV